MNNILYIANFQNDHQIASSMIYSFINQEFPCLTIGCFDNSITKDIYYNYFISYTEHIRLYDTEKSKIILNDYTNRYKWFAILSNNCLYNKNYSAELSKLTENSTHPYIIVCPQNSRQIKDQTILISSKLMMEHIKHDLTVSDICGLYIKSNSTNTVSSFQSINMDYALYNNNVLYLDDYCIFGKFINNNSSTVLLDSMVYINKNNNRVYNIVNNIIGYVTEQSDNNLTIEWQTDNLNDPILTIKYYIDPIRKCYVST